MRSLRLLSIRCAVLAGALLALLAPAYARAATTLHLSADRIAFYYDRFLVEADGNVRVTTSDGLTLTGQTFSMDLKNDRFLVAGSVHLTSPTGSQDGAAAADFLKFGRLYFVPLIADSIGPSTSLRSARDDRGDSALRASGAIPDRWTFLNGDYAHPAKGREMPGDTFDFPDLSTTQPYLYAKSAVIGVNQFVRFQSVVMTLSTAKVLPLPTYYVNFSASPYLSENSLSGANYDGTWQVGGNANSISAVHIRYDTVNKVYLSFEQHIANDNAYAVFSVNPATKPSKFWNMATGMKIGNDFQLRSFSILHTFQYDLSQPLEAQHVSWVSLTQALPSTQGSLQFAYQFVNYCLLATRQSDQICGKPGTEHSILAPSLGNPSQWSLGYSSTNLQLLRRFYHLNYSYRFGIGMNHNAVPLQIFGGTPYRTIWNHYLGFSLYSPSIKLNPDADNAKQYVLNLSLNGQRQWYTVPHHVDTVSGAGSISRVFGNSLAAYLAYSVAQTGDYYNAGQQAAYPSYVPVIGGNSYNSFAAFKGVATQRTLSFGASYTPNPSFAFTILARRHRDFPVPEPGLFALPPTNVLGQPLAADYLGQPPYDISGDVRFRTLGHFYIDVSRTYFFNFGTQRWSPNFVVQITQ